MPPYKKKRKKEKCTQQNAISLNLKVKSIKSHQKIIFPLTGKKKKKKRCSIKKGGDHQVQWFLAQQPQRSLFVTHVLSQKSKTIQPTHTVFKNQYPKCKCLPQSSTKIKYFIIMHMSQITEAAMLKMPRIQSSCLDPITCYLF